MSEKNPILPLYQDILSREQKWIQSRGTIFKVSPVGSDSVSGTYPSLSNDAEDKIVSQKIQPILK